MSTEVHGLAENAQIPSSSAAFLEKLHALQQGRRNGAMQDVQQALEYAQGTIRTLVQVPEPERSEEQERWTRDVAGEFSRLTRIATGADEKTHACAWTEEEFALLQKRSRALLEEIQKCDHIDLTQTEWQIFFRPLILGSDRVSNDEDVPRLLDPFWTLPGAFTAERKSTQKNLLTICPVGLPSMEHDVTFSPIRGTPEEDQLFAVSSGNETLFATFPSLLSPQDGELLTVYGTRDSSLVECMQKGAVFDGKLLIRSIEQEGACVPIMSKRAPKLFLHRSIDPEAMDPHWTLDDQNQNFHWTTPLGEHLPAPQGLSINHAM